MSNPKIVRRDRRRGKHHEKPPTLTMADYYRRLLTSPPGSMAAPTFGDYRRAAGID